MGHLASRTELATGGGSWLYARVSEETESEKAKGLGSEPPEIPPEPKTSLPKERPPNEPLIPTWMKRLAGIVATTAVLVWSAAWWMVSNFGDRIGKVEERLSVIESRLDSHLEWHRSGVGSSGEEDPTPAEATTIDGDPDQVELEPSAGLRSAMQELDIPDDWGGTPEEEEALRLLQSENLTPPDPRMTEEEYRLILFRLVLPALCNWIGEHGQRIADECVRAAVTLDDRVLCRRINGPVHEMLRGCEAAFEALPVAGSGGEAAR